jgi:hypothetical protein
MLLSPAVCIQLYRIRVAVKGNRLLSSALAERQLDGWGSQFNNLGYYDDFHGRQGYQPRDIGRNYLRP